jgi:hypothetical protein
MLFPKVFKSLIILGLIITDLLDSKITGLKEGWSAVDLLIDLRVIGLVISLVIDLLIDLRVVGLVVGLIVNLLMDSTVVSTVISTVVSLVVNSLIDLRVVLLVASFSFLSSLSIFLFAPCIVL